MKTKTALITGASSGLGIEFAKIHAAQGGHLILTARRENKLKKLQAELEANYKVKVLVISKDLTAPNAPEEIYEYAKYSNLKVDYLINNAGFGGIGKFHKREWKKDSAMIQLNIIALTRLSRLFLPDFVARNSGKLLNVSSTASLVPGPLQAVYYATKAYVTSFSNAISEELRDTEVTVTTLLPGSTKTEFGAISGMDKTPAFDTTASAERVATTGYKAMLKGKLNCISGLTFSQKTLLKMLPFLPIKVVLKQIYKMQKTKKQLLYIS